MCVWSKGALSYVRAQLRASGYGVGGQGVILWDYRVGAGGTHASALRAGGQTGQRVGAGGGGGGAGSGAG